MRLPAAVRIDLRSGDGAVPGWLFDLDSPQILALFLCVFVGGTIAGTFWIRPALRRQIRPQADWNAVVTGVLSCFVVFYGLLLGLLAVAAHEQRTQVEDTVSREALHLAGVYGEVAYNYPPEMKEDLRRLLRQYVQTTIDQDWPAQQQGQLPRAGTEVMQQINARMWSFEPRGGREELVHAQLLDAFEVPRDLRRQRLYSVRSGLPTVLWNVVWIGAVLTILFIYLFEMERRNVLVLGGLLAFFIAFLVGVIAVLDRPLRGPRSVPPEPFRVLLEEVLSDQWGPKGHAPSTSPSDP